MARSTPTPPGTTRIRSQRPPRSAAASRSGGASASSRDGVSELRAVRSARTQAEARELALVLAAAGIEHRVARGSDGWRLLVAGADADAAVAAIDAYERERAGTPPSDAAPFESYAGFHLAAALWGFY